MTYAGSMAYETKLDTTGFQKGLNEVTGKTKTAGTSIKSIVAGLGITKIISSAFSTLSSSLDSAISRVDTLNNFPNVMKNLGIATEDSDKAMSKLTEGLKGIPTTLDSATLAVQRFTSVNSDVNKSTDYFLALNNALLAGGASTEIQETALEQLSQAYSKGKMDMVEWRSLQTAMPAQLNQVAQAMGMTTDALGEGLRDGTIAMDDFMEAIVTLNTEGVNGFASFEEQAKSSTGGIATSIKNAKTAVVRGVGEIIKAIDEALENMGLGGISEIIGNIGSEIETGLKGVADLIRGFSTDFDGTLEQLKITAMEKGPEMITNLGQGIANALPSLVENVVQIITTIIEIVVANLPAILEAGTNILFSLADGLIEALPTLIEKIPEIFTNLLNTMDQWLPTLVEKGAELVAKLAIGIIMNLPAIINAIVNLGDVILDELRRLPEHVVEIGKNIVEGLWNGIWNNKDWIIGKVQGFAQSILDGMKDKLGIHSPSTVMRDVIGKMIPKGIAVGIEANIDSVDRAVDKMNSAMVDKMKNAVNIETGQISANATVRSNANYNSLVKVEASFDGDVQLNNSKVGRLIAPNVAKVIKAGGLA